MLRFCGKGFKKPEGVETVIAEEHVCFDKDLWQNSRRYFRDYFCDDITVMRLLPVMDRNGEILCYGWQDGEANRELRMLRELGQNSNALQFGDVFPGIRQVVVHGFNELAYYFVKYLETQKVESLVSGNYWDLMGYQCGLASETDCDDTMVIYAESFYQNTEWYQRIVRSASEEFECINQIYEANVKAGKIKDAGGDFRWFLAQLEGREVAIFGTGAKAQDTYDLLYGHGIDITAFVEKNGYGTGKDDTRTLLGKQVFSIGHVISQMKGTVLVSCTGKNSALGTELTEVLDYYGYERNKYFFLIDDYTVVSYSNLNHILRGKSVLLTGDEVLCQILKEYLERVEGFDIHIRCVKLERGCADDGILCIVHPWCGDGYAANNPRLRQLEEELKVAGDISYTMYFSHVRVFVLINEYLNTGMGKYTIRQLIPKGILCGAIPNGAGNTFVRGIFDGHSDILMLPYSDWNENILLHCIRLSDEKPDDMIKEFKDMAESFLGSVDDQFEESIGYWLSQKGGFTPQELFIIFHIAYSEVKNGKRITDLSQKIVYWEPHYINRMDFPFLQKWLEAPCINGYTIAMRRDGITRCGSLYKLCIQLKRIYDIISDTVSDRITSEYWQVLWVRFEDFKLHPRKELTKICAVAGIPWSDTMMRTTLDGNEWGYYEIKDFDLKPVFNKYEEYFSAFDRFRMAIICSPYQKRYGYTYENCMKFARKELWEMFLKGFRFQQELQFVSEKERTGYILAVYEILRWQLWNARKHMVLDDITPKFGSVELSTSSG